MEKKKGFRNTEKLLADDIATIDVRKFMCHDQCPVLKIQRLTVIYGYIYAWFSMRQDHGLID